MTKFIPQSFNDLLALILIFLIPAIWIAQGCGKITMPTEVNGGLLVTWTLIIQYYFRKAKTEA
jgi:hypothetical protein